MGAAKEWDDFSSGDSSRRSTDLSIGVGSYEEEGSRVKWSKDELTYVVNYCRLLDIMV